MKSKFCFVFLLCCSLFVFPRIHLFAQCNVVSGNLFPVVSANDPSCPNSADGELTVAAYAPGSTPSTTFPYSWEWHEGTANGPLLASGIALGTLPQLVGCGKISNLSSGTYVLITCDANGQSFINTYSIYWQGFFPGTPEIGGNNQFCKNDSSLLTTSNAHSYQWYINGTAIPGAINDSLYAKDAGDYSVIVNYNGCEFSSDNFYLESSSVILNSTSVNPTCNESDGVITINAAAGTAPYSYVWNTGSTNDTIENLSAGKYAVHVQDSFGCSTDDSVFLSNNNAPLVTLSIDSTTCYNTCDGSVSTLVNGNAPFSYNWSTGDSSAFISNLCAGNYFLKITDTLGCIAFVSVKVGSLSNIKLSGSTIAAGCTQNNGSISVTASEGVSPYSYSWNSSPAQYAATAIDLSEGIYTVTVTDSLLCSMSFSDTIFIDYGNNTLQIDFQKENVSCINASDGWATISVTGGVAPYAYSWNTNSSQTNDTISDLSAGTYSVAATDSNNCIIKQDITIDPNCNISCITTDIIGEDFTSEKSSLLIFPNPTQNSIMVSYSVKSSNYNSELKIYDVFGKLVKVQTIQTAAGTLTLDLSELAGGIYQIILINENQLKAKSKVVLNK